MRFKLKSNEQAKHAEMVNSLAWTMSNEVFRYRFKISISDDKVVYKWDLQSPVPQKLIELDQYPTDIDHPVSKALNDCFAIGFVDGSFRLLTKQGKIDKVVPDAHKGALIALKWSSDGYSLVTAGEDGQIKIWSKSGNLRSSFVQMESPIYCICWNPDNEQVLYCSDKMIHIKPLQAGQKQIQWRAHDGVVLCCDWNASSNMIVSGGEDCKFKIWDSYGRLLYCSSAYDYVINSIKWAPNGEYFAVGAFEMLKLCDKTGWTYSFSKTNVGSLMKLSWSSDSTICAGAGGNGQVLFANIADKIIQKDNWELKLTDENKIQVTDLINEVNEELDFKDRVINVSMAFNNLIVTSQAKFYIYGENNWNTPHILEIKDKDQVSLIIQSPRLFALVQIQNGIMVYNYDGKLISNPKIAGAKFEQLSNKKLALSQDVLCILDPTNNKKLLFYDVLTGKQMTYTLEHSLEIQEISLNQSDNLSDRKVVFIDQNRDLQISPVHKKDIVKLCAMTDSFIWNDKSDILVALSDERIHTWYYPNAVYIDRDLQSLIKTSKVALIFKENSEFGRHAQLINYSDTLVTIRRKDGAQITHTTSPYPKILLDFCETGKWEKAIKICRFVKEKTLWAVLASISLNYRELNTAEIALAACEFIDKVQYINYIKDLPSEISRNAAISLYFHKYDEALQILIHSKLYYRAIKLNIKLYRWEKALEIAISNKTHVDTVIGYRIKYLQKVQKEEWLPKFQKLLKDVKVDWEQIKQVIYAEKEREQKLR